MERHGRASIVGPAASNTRNTSTHCRPASDDPLWVTLYLSHSVVKPAIRCQGNEWPSQFKGFSLRWRKQKKKRRIWLPVKLCISRCPSKGESTGRTAIPSQRDLERSRRSRAALQSSEYVSGSCFVARGEEAPAGLLHLLTETCGWSAKQGRTTTPISVKCSA